MASVIIKKKNETISLHPPTGGSDGESKQGRLDEKINLLKNSNDSLKNGTVTVKKIRKQVKERLKSSLMVKELKKLVHKRAIKLADKLIASMTGNADSFNAPVPLRGDRDIEKLILKEATSFAAKKKKC